MCILEHILHAVCTYWNCLYEEIPIGTYNIMLLKLRDAVSKFSFKYHVRFVFAAFKQLKLQITIKTPIIIPEFVFLLYTKK